MTTPLDEKAVSAAHEAYAKTTGGLLDGKPMVNAIRAYLSNTPAPDGLEVDEFVRKLRDFEQAYNIEFFAPLTEAEKDEMGGFLLSRASAEMGRHLSKFLTQAADRIDQAQSALAAVMKERDEVREALADAMAGAYIKGFERNARSRQISSVTVWDRENDTYARFIPEATAEAEVKRLAEELKNCGSALAQEVEDRLNAEARIKALEEALGNMRCPRPCNHRPDEFNAKDCVAAGECGCGAHILNSREKADG